MRNTLRWRDAQQPGRILDKLINDYIEHRLGGSLSFEQVAVLEIDVVGGKLAGPDTDRPEQVPNPRGSILGRTITNAIDKDTPDESLGVFWPLNQHDLMPIKEGESVIVIYLDEAKTHGLWICRYPDPQGVNNLNFTPLTKKFTDDSENNLKDSTGEAHKAVQDLEEDPGVPSVNEDFIISEKDSPEFNQRVGDRVIHGSNNTMIVLSRDRVDSVSSGEKDKAGSIDIVVGRVGEDMSVNDDAARVYISQKTDADRNFSAPGDGVGSASFVVAKADQIRLFARNGMKLSVKSGPTSIVIDDKGKVSIETKDAIEVKSDSMKISTNGNIVLDAGKEVQIGSEGATHKLVKGDALKDFLQNCMVSILATSPVDVAGIPGIGVINSAVVTALTNAFNSYDTTVLSNNNKVED